MKHFTDLLGRVLLSFIFLYEAYDSVKYIKITKAVMATYGLTWRQDLLLYGAVTFLVLGGLMVLLGYRARLGAFLLLLYWLPVTFIVHGFWKHPAGADVYRWEAIMFMKNIAIAGGLFMIMANGTGAWALRRLFATARVRGA
jgi:putative oxidoreductase